MYIGFEKPALFENPLWKGKRIISTGVSKAMNFEFKNRFYKFLAMVLAVLVAIPIGMALADTIAPAQSIQSDKADYAPGDTVILTGKNWQPGEAVNIWVNDDQGQGWSRNVDVTADANGEIRDEFTLPDWYIATYYVTATGASSGTAKTTFTDGNVKVFAAPSGVTYTLSVTKYTSTNCSGTGTSQPSVSINSNGTNVDAGNNQESIKLQAPANSDQGTAFQGWSGDAFTTVSGSGNRAICVQGAQQGGRQYTATYSAPTTNQAPTASGQTVTTNEDTAKTITLSGSDADGNNLSFAIVSGPTHGSLGSIGAVTCSGTTPKTCTANVTYTPSADYNGSDSFTFKVNDGTADSNTATVSITVNAVNDPPVAASQSVTTNEDTAKAITLSATDVDNSGLTYSVVSSPAHGTISGTAPNLTYTPNLNYNGTDSFTFKANDGTADSNIATVSITITAVNDAPVAAGDGYSTNEDTTLNVDSSHGVLVNDTDVDGNTLTATKVSGPSHGTLTLNSNGSFTYTPDANYNGSDNFTYKANDGTVDSNTATVSITVTAVNDAPQISLPGASLSYTENDTPKIIDSGATASDIDSADFDTGTLTVDFSANGKAEDRLAINNQGTGSGQISVSGSNVSYGNTVIGTFTGGSGTTPLVVTFNSSATPMAAQALMRNITYANASENPSTTARTVRFVLTDGDGGTSNTATKTINVTAVNDPPVLATIGDQSAKENEELTFTASATDPDSDAITYSLKDAPAGATIDPSSGNFSWTPSYDDSGTYTLTVVASDGTDSDEQQITITVENVNRAPVLATIDDQTVKENEELTFTASATDPDGDSVTYSLKDAPAGATIDPSTGTFSWTPSYDDSGTYTLTVVASDGTDSDEQQITITVENVNRAPSCEDVSITTNEDTPGSTSPNCTDPDDDPLTYAIVSNGQNGTAAVDASGKLTYNPKSNYNGPDSFTYKADDGPADSNDATVSVSVTAVNDAPDAADDSTTTYEDSSVTIDVLANDSDVDGDTLSLDSSTDGTHGTVKTSDGKLVYTPAVNYYGTDSFSYTASDGHGKTDTATVNVTVNAVNDAPSFTKGADQTVNEDAGAQTVTGWATNISAGPNESNQTVSFLVSNDNNSLFTSGQGQPAIASNGTLTYTPAADANGSATVTVSLKDNGGTDNGGVDTSAAQTFTITVKPVNDAPKVSTSQTGSQNVQYTDPISAVTISATDVDTAGSSLTATSQFNKDGGQFGTGLPSGLSLATDSTSSNSATWKLSGKAQVAPGTYVVRVTVSDGSATASADVKIVVTQENATVEYTGNTLFWTSGTTSTSAKVTLAATIKDNTDLDTGDIRNAKVTFKKDNADIGCNNMNVGLVSASDTTVGTATCSTTLSASSTTGGTSYTIGVWVNNYYVGQLDTPVVVTVAQPLTSNFITGGGFLKLANPSSPSDPKSSGQCAGTPDTRNNFGFNVKYNKGGTNLQGNLNTIYRTTSPCPGSTGSGPHLYQVKANAMNSLTVYTAGQKDAQGKELCPSTPSTTKCAAFTSKANVQDVTNPNAPVSIGGNRLIEVKMTDKGEPGSSDSIAITVYNDSTSGSGIWYSSKWNGSLTLEQVLSGGNLAVR